MTEIDYIGGWTEVVRTEDAGVMVAVCAHVDEGVRICRGASEDVEMA